MPLEGQLKARLERALSVVEDHGARGTRLLDDAVRLVKRVRRFIDRGLIDPATDSTALEVACYALQLPLKSSRLGGWGGRPGRTTLRDRAEQAAEMLVGLAGEDGDDDREALLDQATELLVQVHQRHPETEQARLLADALNLEDFGVIGLVEQAVALARQGGGVMQVADGLEKREQYGYWEARMHDGFHFEPVRAIAKKRLEHARRTAALLLGELKEDGAV
jgi:hypothetical protein